MAKSTLAKVNKKIENGVVGGYKKIEEGVVGGFQKITDKFVDNYLTQEGESVKDAKERIAAEQKEREEKASQDLNTRKQAQEDVVKKNIEVSMNAGKR